MGQAQDKGTLHRGILRNLLVAAALVFFIPSRSLMAAGLVVFLLGALMHLWSKGCLVRNVVVTTTGPYRFVRHPFYLANLLIDTGISLMSGNVYVLAGYLPVFFFVYLRTIRAEERYLTEVHGRAYLDYMHQVPMLVPWKFWRIPGPLEASWLNVWRESEIPRLMRICTIPFLFPLRAAVFNRDFVGPDWPVVLIGSLAMIGITQGGSIYLRRRLRKMVPHVA